MTIALITSGDTQARAKINAAIDKANLVDGKADVASLAAEASARSAADSTETAARIAAVQGEATARGAAVSAEASARIVADNNEASQRFAGIAAEAAARIAADQNEATQRISGDTAEVTARIAADRALPIAVQAQHRPGDAPFNFALGIAGGDISASTPLDASLSVVQDNGREIQLTGNGIVAPREMYPLEPNKTYLVEFAVQRRVNSTDPANDAIRCALAWFGQGRTPLAGGSAQTVVTDLTTATTGSGRLIVSAIVSLAAGASVNIVTPAGARYVKPFVQSFGTVAKTGVQVIGWRDITNANVVAPDVSALAARISTQESLHAGDRLNALETSLAAPGVATFKTLGDMQAANIGVTVDIIDLLGATVAGDAPAKSFKRAAAQAAGTNKVQTHDGAWWEPVPIREMLMSARVVYVRTTGSDSNSGTSAVDAFVTIGAAIAQVQAYDFNGKNVQINIGAGVLVESCYIKGLVGAGNLVFMGAGRALTTWRSTDNFAPIRCINCGGVEIYFDNIKMEKLAGSCRGLIEPYGPTNIYINGGMEFGAAPFAHLYSHDVATNISLLSSNYFISGDADSHYCAVAGEIAIENCNPTLIGTPHFAGAFARATNTGHIEFINTSYIGSATGVKYRAANGGVINVHGAGHIVFPGDQFGIVDRLTNGVYSDDPPFGNLPWTTPNPAPMYGIGTITATAATLCKNVGPFIFISVTLHVTRAESSPVGIEITLPFTPTSDCVLVGSESQNNRTLTCAITNGSNTARVKWEGGWPSPVGPSIDDYWTISGFYVA